MPPSSRCASSSSKASVCLAPIRGPLTSKAVHTIASGNNGEVGFGEIEADFLYAFIAEKQPRQVFQIGCGVSTAVCLMAAQDAGYQPEVICVEPYPTQYLLREANAGRITLLREKVELLDLKVIEDLGADLLFFVDSTHTLGPAGEVSRIILEMLPRLRAGAYAHFHDITFPYDYSRHTLTSALFFQHESVLLQATQGWRRAAGTSPARRICKQSPEPPHERVYPRTITVPLWAYVLAKLDAECRIDTADAGHPGLCNIGRRSSRACRLCRLPH